MSRSNKSSAKKHNNKINLSNLKKIFVGLIFFTFGVIAVLFFNKMIRSNLEKIDYKQPLVLKNAVYCSGEKLDIKVPIRGNGSNKPPLLVYVHGGGWMFGSKVGGAAPYFYKLTNNNIAVASINYRLSGVSKFPESVKDVICAVKYLKNSADIFGFDSNNIFLAGQSSGANLALMAGLAAENPIFEQSKYPDVSSQVSGIIALDAHYDLNFSDLSEDTKINISKYLSSQKDSYIASPINYLSNSSPHILIFHGLKDKRIPIASARLFEKSAGLAGAEVKLVEVKNADHNLNSFLKNEKPSANERLEIIKSFIEGNIKK